MICRHKLNHFTVANTRFTAPLTRRGKTKFATIKWFNLCLQIIQSQTCYPLSGIAVEMRFLLDSKYGAASFIAIVTSCYLRKDMRKFTSVILYMNIICIAQWLFNPKFDILHCSCAFARRHKHCKPECSFMQTCADYFLQWKYDVISQLHVRHSYTKNSLCVTRSHMRLLKFSVKFPALIKWWKTYLPLRYSIQYANSRWITWMKF